MCHLEVFVYVCSNVCEADIENELQDPYYLIFLSIYFLYILLCFFFIFKVESCNRLFFPIVIYNQKKQFLEQEKMMVVLCSLGID